jgi:two-component system NtrC family response regulator
MSYNWPGNVRELEHAIERAVILAREKKLDITLFPSLPRAEAPARKPVGPVVPGATIADIERDAILRTLEAVGGSTARAAAILQISPRTIQYKIKQYRAEGAAVVTSHGSRSQGKAGAGDPSAPEAEDEPHPAPVHAESIA